jgi:hypothetical protein
MATRTLTIAFLMSLVSITYGQTDPQIKLFFKKFQEGYTKRDTSQVDKFTAELCSKDIQLIGTGDDEWFQGIDAARSLFKDDWKYWFDLTIDTSNIYLSGGDDYKFFMVRGTSSMTFPNKDSAYNYAMDILNEIIEDQKTSRGKLLAYSSVSADLIQQIESGSLEIKFSIRLSGGLVKQNDKWQFKQLVYDYPYPMTRK